MIKYLLAAIILFASYISGFTQILSQTRTATRLNYNFTGNLANAYPKATASDVQADDNIYATSNRFSPNHGAPTLVLQGFGFDIPPAATIENIIIKVRRLKVGNGTVSEYFVSLVRNRNRLPEWWETYGFVWRDSINTNPTNLIPAVETEKTYAQAGGGNGGPNNQPYQWTATMTNDPLFGVELIAGAAQGSSVVVKYDYAEVTVEYSQPPAVAGKFAGRTEVKPMSEPIVYPNPFTTKTNIQFTAAETGKAVIELFDINGARVRTLFSGSVIRGQVYTVTVGDALLRKGTYVYLISNGSRKQRGQIIKLQ